MRIDRREHNFCPCDTLGRAVVFGDHFVHATQTGAAPSPLAFLSFTFGRRGLTESQWASAEAYVREQNPIYADPAGRIVRSTAFTHGEAHERRRGQGAGR